jgi:general secretion pathway protein D
VAAALCGLAIPLLAQQRPGGGGGGGGFGGGAGRSSTAASASSTTGAIDRPGNGQIGSANFYVDPDTGKVVVIADSNTLSRVSEVVSNLGRPKPQVLIKVVFLEVTYNKGYDVGIEGGVRKDLHAGTQLNASNLFSLASQGNNPTTGVTTVPGAGIYSVVGNDFSATLRAIAEVGKVEVLSRPTILARNNQMATIQVGQNVPLINNVTYDTFGNEHIGIQYSTVGIILQVTPFIQPDDMVEMIVAPQISAVDPTLSQVIAYATNGGAISAPYIDVRQANTVVVTPNGQTVVIGGLMQHSKSSTDSKIPILGDIPGLGQLFHHKTKSDQKTELIILLTPYVVRTPADLARMSQDERGRTQLAPQSFPQQEMNQYLEPGNTAAPPPVANPRQAR